MIELLARVKAVMIYFDEADRLMEDSDRTNH
ncbi:hypothetical protein Cha6605_5379 [Chamaesiphon minutus PCC 6605]|uniref:Uncharacterized protein n=1 Tax=Chamaesiphon minutus (strain ATCC 27169 / PCC 6605) TaxID=1173020 RepID=K9UPE0_CHAP6|nr:hypothetical protein Cha6605_5379 [Chamaesiphon minutus PCC 6605]